MNGVNMNRRKSKKRIEDAINYAHSRLGFLENCINGNIDQINLEIIIHQKYLSILENKEE